MSAVSDAQFVASRDVLNRSEHSKLSAIVEHGHDVGRFVLGGLVHLSCYHETRQQISRSETINNRLANRSRPQCDLAGDKQSALMIGCVQRVHVEQEAFLADIKDVARVLRIRIVRDFEAVHRQTLALGHIDLGSHALTFARHLHNLQLVPDVFVAQVPRLEIERPRDRRQVRCALVLLLLLRSNAGSSVSPMLRRPNNAC